MIHKSALPFLACVILVGCAQPYDTPAYRGEVASPPVTATAPIPPVPPASTLQLRMTGSVVGLPVVDQAGQPIGIVQAVAADRGSGQIHDLIIASPSFGLGYYIAVPAVNAQTTGDRVVLNAPAVAWLQAPRYGSQQLSAMYGPS